MVSRAYKKKLRILFIGAITITILIVAFIIREYSRSFEISSTDVLRSLPYLAWHPVEETIEKKGVIKYDQTKSFKGINIYNSIKSSPCYLIDMFGNILHTWSTTEHRWHYARICKNGGLLVILGNDHSLAMLDWDSNIKWIKRKMQFSHEIAVAENNDIYSIIGENKRVFKFGLPFPIRNDYIIVLSADGEIKRKISMFKVLKKGIPLDKYIKIYSRIIFRNIKKIDESKRKSHFFSVDYFNILNTNTIGMIDRDIAGLCKKGDLLICARNLDLIGILDIKKERLIWSWGPGNLDKPHHPTLLENGNILIFDNGVKRGYSRIVELNPLTKEIVWEYKTNPPGQFYSSRGGSSQRLPNGNTLITESDKGHVFEVTYDGEIVWEFYNPKIKKDRKERATIYRMMRITDPENYPCLESLQ